MSPIKKIKLFFLYHQKKYNKVLESTVINEFKDIDKISTLYLRYQAYSSFYTKNYHHSRMCLEILKEKNNLNAKDANFLAFIYARHNEKEKAITAWCYTLEKKRNDKIAKQALDYLREKGRDINLMDDEYFDSIHPKEPFAIPLKFILTMFIVMFLSLSIFFPVYYNINRITDFVKNISFKRDQELSKVKLPDYNPNLLTSPKDETIKFSFDEKEVKRKFDNIKLNIIADKVVDAQLEINEIKLSNASGSVKLKMGVLETFMREPDYAFFKNRIKYSDVINEQKQSGGNIKIYDSIYILWDGRIVNQKVNSDNITFDLIIGNEEKGIVEGIVGVKFKKAILIKNNDKIKVFGKLIIDGSNFNIDGKYIIK